MSGLFRLAEVLAVINADFGERVEDALEEFRARSDDAYWARFVRAPFTWQRFTTWWVARRWVRPRDVTRG